MALSGSRFLKKSMLFLTKFRHFTPFSVFRSRLHPTLSPILESWLRPSNACTSWLFQTVSSCTHTTFTDRVDATPGSNQPSDQRRRERDEWRQRRFPSCGQLRQRGPRPSAFHRRGAAACTGKAGPSDEAEAGRGAGLCSGKETGRSIIHCII